MAHRYKVLLAISVAAAATIFIGSRSTAQYQAPSGYQVPVTKQQQANRMPQVANDSSTRLSAHNNDPNGPSLPSATAVRFTNSGELKFAVADESGQVRLLDPMKLSTLIAQFGQAVAAIPCGDQILPERVTLSLGELELRYYVKGNCEAGTGQFYIPGSEMQRKHKPGGNPHPPAAGSLAPNPQARPQPYQQQAAPRPGGH